MFIKAKWLEDVVEVMGIDDEESGFEDEMLAEIRTKDDEYTVALDELEAMPDDTENGKYFISDSPKKPARFNPRRSAQFASSAFYSLSEQIRQQYQACPIRSTMKYTRTLQNWIFRT